MKPRERVILALDHKEADRIPIDLGGSICSSIHKNNIQAFVPPENIVAAYETALEYGKY